MLKTSAAFAALLDTAPLRLHLTLADGTEIPRAAIKSAEWAGGSNAGDDITLGSTVAVQLKAELDLEQLGSPILADAELTATLTIDGTDDILPVAKLRVDDPKSDDDKLTVSACDAMMWAFGVEYALDDDALGFNWEAGVDGETLLRAICREQGVELAVDDLPPILLQYASPAGYTYREVIAFLACMWGRFARIDAEGRLTFQWYANISTDETAEDDGHALPARTVGPGRYYDGELTMAAYEYTIGYLKCYAEPLEETLLAGDTTKAQGIYIKCPWMTQERLEAVWAAVGGFTYRPVTGLRFLGDPRLEPGDMILVTTRDGSACAVPCMTIRHEYDGGLITEISAAGKSESASKEDYMGPVTRQIERTKREINASIIKYEDRLEAMVKDEVEGLSSAVTMELQSITEQVNGLDDAYAALHLEVGGITTKVNGYDGRFSLLEQTLDGLVYTDEGGKVMIKNGSINLTGSITWGDLTSDVQNRVGGVTEETVHTLIKDDLVASPNVRGANIYGGTFWNTSGSHRMEMGESSGSGVFRLYNKLYNNVPYFSIYDDTSGAVSLMKTGLTFLTVSGANTPTLEPWGGWDFSGATVIGPKFAQVSRLTSDHTEFYLYIVFGGVGVYTPVFAAALGRTYTTAAANNNGEYPIYGIIFNISTSGTVSVSKIYGVYPYSKHQSGIDFTASSVTIYAR